jgi:hypothetical protein
METIICISIICIFLIWLIWYTIKTKQNRVTVEELIRQSKERQKMNEGYGKELDKLLED